MSGGIADTLAAHQLRLRLPLPGAECSNKTCAHYYTGGAAGIERHHAAHQAEVLSSAGYGDLSALLDDLRGLIDLAEGHARVRAGSVHVEHLYPLLARYAPSDHTPKEQR